MVGLIYAHNQLSMHLRPSNRVISLFCQNNRRFAQIVLIWSYRLLKVDFETEVGLIIVLRQHHDHTRKFGEITQNKGHYAIQCHQFWYQSKAHVRLPISD